MANEFKNVFLKIKSHYGKSIYIRFMQRKSCKLRINKCNDIFCQFLNIFIEVCENKETY